MARRVGMSSSGYSHYETPARFKEAFLPMSVALDFAKAMGGTGVEASEVLALAGAAPGTANAIPAPTGFSEAATPYEFREHPTNPEDPQRGLRAIFGKTATTPASFVLQANYPAFSLLRGDVLICDLARLPLPGELALVTIVNDHNASSATSVRRFWPPFLGSGDLPGDDQLRIDQAGVTVRCSVIGLIRGLADAGK